MRRPATRLLVFCLQLRERGKLEDLLLLYQGKNMHRAALELLQLRLDNAMNEIDNARGDSFADRHAVSTATEAIVTYLKKLGSSCCWCQCK